MTVPRLQNILRNMSWGWAIRKQRQHQKPCLFHFKIGASMWSVTPGEMRSIHPCNTESGSVLATPFGPARLTDAKAENTERKGGCISTFKLCRKDKWDFWKMAVSKRALIPTEDQWDVIAKTHERLLEEKAEDTIASQRNSKTDSIAINDTRFSRCPKDNGYNVLRRVFRISTWMVTWP